MKPQTDKRLFPLHRVSTLDARDPVIGDFPLSWSEDNCIALGTSKCILLYDLNPLKKADCLEVLFKIQAVNVPGGLHYDVGAKELYENHDKLRSVVSRDAALPCYDTYRMYLHGEKDDSPGIKVLSFSPCCCAPQDGSVLAVLTTGHRLQLYIKSSDGASIGWTMALDLSEILVDTLSKHGGFYPNVEMPDTETTPAAIWEKQFSACINYITWGDIVSYEDEKYIFLLACTKNNYLLIWKLKLPICTFSDAVILSYTKISDGEVKSLTVLTSSFTSVGTIDVAFGEVGGNVTCFSFDGDGKFVQESKIWKENDELEALCMNWTLSPTDKGQSDLLVGKGFIVLYVRITADLQILSHFVSNNTHTFPIISLIPAGPSVWLSASQDGKIARMWLDSEPAGLDGLQIEILMETDEQPSLFQDTTHHMVASPNLAFLALLKSKPKVSRSVMTKNSSYLEIRTLETGMKSFEHLCLEGARDDTLKIDTVESVRQHLLHKEFFSDATEMTLLRACIGQYLSSKVGASPVKWCLARIYNGPNYQYEETLLTLEKEIVSKQMLKVLNWWISVDHCDDSKDLPIRNIVKWLIENKNLLEAEDFSLVDSIENSQKYRGCAPEVCAITGEPLLLSEDASYAITKISGIRWPRCCLTFSVLQGFKSRKCEVSNSRCLILEGAMCDLLTGRSIYSGLPMV